MPYFLSYDVGTSSVKSILIDEKGKVYANAIKHYPLHMPRPGWVEQNPLHYWLAIVKATHTMLQNADIDKNQIAGMVFTTQAMGVIPVDKQGEVLHDNITWVDGRAEKEAVKAMNRLLGKSVFKMIVGLELTGKDVIPKLMWLKENRPEIFEKTHKVLDVNGYLKFKATGKMVAEWSGACSYAFNLKKKDWERIFFQITGVGTDKLPDLVKSVDEVGNLTPEAAAELGIPQRVKVFGGCDDTQSAALGTGAIGEGEAHIYLGTSAWLGVTSHKDFGFKNGAACLQSAMPDKNLVVGITESAGVNIDWIINRFYNSEKQHLTEQQIFEILEKEVANVPPGSDHLIFTPWFLGERAPVSTTTTRSTVFNLGHEHTRGHLVQAHFEGIAYNLRWTLENMQKDFRFNPSQIFVTGGGSQNARWMQAIANITQKKIITSGQPKLAGAIGASVIAMVGSGAISGFESIHQIVEKRAEFEPDKSTFAVYNKLFADYKNVYHSLKNAYIKANKERFNTAG